MILLLEPSLSTIVVFGVKVVEMPVALEVTKVHSRHYMLVVKKTKAILYRISLNKELKSLLFPMCGINLNSTIIRTGIMNTKLYNLFFTAAHLLPLTSAKKHYELLTDTQENSTKGTRRKSDMESKITKIGLTESALGKDESLDRSFDINKKSKTRDKLMVYLADSNGFLHVYSVTNLFHD